MVEAAQERGSAAVEDGPDVCVFAPVTLLTLTLERSPAGVDEIHVHPGGQGVWVARMITALSARAVLCTPLGGETGTVVEHLLGLERIGVRGVSTQGACGAWIQDRRQGERRFLWRGEPAALGRHELDELYSATLAEAMGAGVCVIAGSHRARHVLHADAVQRLTSDLAASGVRLVVDLSGSELRAALDARPEVVKLSREELVADGWAEEGSEARLLEGVERLRASGARNVVLSLAGAGAIAALEDGTYSVQAPELEVADARGAGDSMTAAIAVGLARGLPWDGVLRLAAAAGAMNVTRHGSGSGRADTIAQLAERVTLSRLEVAAG